MSAETTEALEAALQAHIDDENPGQLVTGWVTQVVCSSVEDMDTNWYVQLTPARQPFYATAGLVKIAGFDIADTWADDDDD